MTGGTDAAAVRALYGASLSPDATAFAHLVDDGGWPRAVQRFLTGWRASSSRDVELPVRGPVTRVIHSAAGHWLACEVAPDGGDRRQIWVVTTDPDDRAARRIDAGGPHGRDADAGTAELIGWDGERVAAILTGDDGIGSSCLIDPVDGAVEVLDRRSAGRLVDAWAGTALVRTGPRGYRELLLLRGGTEMALLTPDPGSTTDLGIILDDHQPRRVRCGPAGDLTRLAYPAKTHPRDSAEGYVRVLVRSDNGGDRARLLEVTATADGATYQVIAEREDCDLDEFVVSDDLSTVAMLWNRDGVSELQVLELSDHTALPPIPLPGPVAGELSISAGGAMVALTVQGPGMPRTVELVEPRSGEWQHVERGVAGADPAAGAATRPSLERMVARDGLAFSGWLYRPPPRVAPLGALIWLHGGPEGQSRPEYSDVFPVLSAAGVTVFAPNVRGSGGAGRAFMHADDVERRGAAIDDVADAVAHLTAIGAATPGRIACGGWSYGGYLTLAALTTHPELFAAGVSVCGMSDLTTFLRNTDPWIADAAYAKYGHPLRDRELLERLSPLRAVDALRAPLLVVHGAADTNVPVSESDQIVDALLARGRAVRYVSFDDDGHDIAKRENRATLAREMRGWLQASFAAHSVAS